MLLVGSHQWCVTCRFYENNIWINSKCYTFIDKTTNKELVKKNLNVRENQSGNGEWMKTKVAIENGRKPKWQLRMDENQGGNGEWTKTKVAIENG